MKIAERQCALQLLIFVVVSCSSSASVWLVPAVPAAWL